MASQLDVAEGRDIVARWCNLAEQRLKYLTELFDSGRWRRFHGEQEFLENVREAKSAVDTWRDLLSREASRDNRPIDLSWLGRSRAALRRNEYRPDPELFEPLDFKPLDPRPHNPKPLNPEPMWPIADVPVTPPRAMSDVREQVEASRKQASAEPPEQDSWAAVLDLATIAARYPLLRNTF
jgi:uncharacterized repeat protein (TIGR03809 family)